MDANKIKARCIRITDKDGNSAKEIGGPLLKGLLLDRIEYEFNNNLRVTLKDNRGNIGTFGATYVVDKITSGDLEVTNLQVDTYSNRTVLYLIRNMNTMLNRGLEDDSQKAQNKALNIFEKSKLVGACHVDSNGILNGGTYDKLMITDKSNKISGDIVANEVWIDGSMDLVRTQNPHMLSIKCDKLVIKNPMAMINLRADCIIHIMAEHIEIKHKFIDVNTVKEIQSLYDNTYRESSKQYITKFQDIYIGFDEADYNEIINIVLNEMDERFKDRHCLELMISTMYWAICMWKSTGKTSTKIIDKLQEYRDYICTNLGTYGEFKDIQNINKEVSRYSDSDLYYLSKIAFRLSGLLAEIKI